MADEKRRTVRVECQMANGLTLRLFKLGYDDGTGSGVRGTVVDGPPVVVRGPSPIAAGVGNPSRGNPVLTTVDAEWMDRWMEQNKQDPLVTRGLIRVLPDDEGSR